MFESRMKKMLSFSSLLLISAVISSVHAAKPDDQKKKKASAKVAKKQAAKAVAQPKPVGGQTVGDVLHGIERKTREVEIKKTSQSLPTFKKAVAPAQNSQALNLKNVKPPRSSSMYYPEGTNEAKLEKVTDQGINQLYKLTQQFKNSPRRGELWLRLAELYVEKARLIEFKLQQEYDREVKEFNEEKTKTRPQLNLKPAQEYNLKAIQLYEAFLHDFPKDAKVDQALFFLGYNYFELNQADKGKTFYERLVKEMPQSAYVEESYFALGEYHFDRNEWEKALSYYQKIGNSKHSRLRSFAEYKEAWCLYKVGKTKQALSALEKVIEAGRASKSEKDSSAGGVSRIRLATEATRDLVVFYAEAGKAENAKSYFESITDEKNVAPMLDRLAYYYSDTGQKDSARLLFQQLIQDNPGGAKAFDYQYQIVQMYTFSGSPNVFKDELYQWINTYGPDSSWYAANKKNPDVGAKSQQLIETTLRNYILQQHQTAQNSKAPHSQKVAKEGYELYFKTFKNGQKMDEMHFFFGELLFDQEAFEEAAVHYNWVVQNAPKSQYYDKASLNSVLALEKKLPKPEEMKKNIAGSVESIPLEKSVQEFISAGEKYISLKPKDEAAIAIRYKIGSLYYYHNQFDKALDVFNEILNKHPKTQYAEYAANLMLDIYNLKKDYQGLEAAGQKILSIPELAKTPVAAQVQNVLQRTSFKKAQDLEGGKDYLKAAQSYEDFASKNPNTELGMNANFNAAVNYERAGDIAKAVALYTIVLNSPQNKNEAMKNNVRKFLGALYERTGQYHKAAESFADYASKNSKDKEAVSFHFNAAIIYDGFNEYKKATENYNKYFELSRSAERKEVFYLLAKMDERRGQIKSAIDNYDRYIQSGPSDSTHVVEAAFRIAELHKQRRQMDEAEKAYRRVLAISKRLASAGKPAGVPYAAEAKFNQVYKTYDDLKSVRIPNNPAEQGKAVQNKLAILNRLKEQLKEVISYDDGPMVVASLTLIGQAYQHMAAAVYAVPIPKGLDEAGLKQYKAGIDQIAKPFQDEAVKNYEAAVQKGFQLEAYNKWLKTANRELYILAPDKATDLGEKALPLIVMDTMEGAKESNSNRKALKAELQKSFKLKNEAAMLRAANQILGEDPSDLETLNTLAVFYKEEGKPGLSQLIILRALKDHPNEATLHNNLAVVLQTTGQQRSAQGSYRKAIELNNKHLEAHMNLGSLQTEFGDGKAGAESLELPYSQKKKDSGLALANNYAVSLSRIGKLDQARKMFEEMTEKNSNVPSSVWLNYAILMVERVKNFKDAQKPLNKARYNSEDASIQRRVDELDSRMRSK